MIEPKICEKKINLEMDENVYNVWTCKRNQKPPNDKFREIVTLPLEDHDVKITLKITAISAKKVQEYQKKFGNLIVNTCCSEKQPFFDLTVSTFDYIYFRCNGISEQTLEKYCKKFESIIHISKCNFICLECSDDVLCFCESFHQCNKECGGDRFDVEILLNSFHEKIF